MTFRQFAKLPLDRQQAVHKAYLTLMLPPEAEPVGNNTVALPDGHWSAELKIMVGVPVDAHEGNAAARAHRTVRGEAAGLISLDA
jgi:hypothetical protein